MTCTACFAAVMIQRDGLWGVSWPKELEPFEGQATTVRVMTGIHETWYVIPFGNREEFEKAWPHILKLKSKGAPLILEKSPWQGFGDVKMAAGVCVLWPSGGSVRVADGTELEATAPWPESIKSASAELPEYVFAKGGTWVPFSGGEREWPLIRARVDIVLVTDGGVVDLNRIELPGDTPIIDKRFKK